MSDWHGYPQHPDAHPERPWWRRVTEPGWATQLAITVARGGSPALPDSWWERSDGRDTRAHPDAYAPSDPMWCDVMDAEHPLPPPPPRCGQTWVNVPTGQARQVTYVSPGGEVDIGRRTLYLALDPDLWPPPEGVLVAGPGAPWAPMGGS